MRYGSVVRLRSDHAASYNVTLRPLAVAALLIMATVTAESDSSSSR